MNVTWRETLAAAAVPRQPHSKTQAGGCDPRWSAARCQKVSTRLLGPHGDRFRLAADAAGVRLEAGGALASTVPAGRAQALPLGGRLRSG